MVMLTVVGKTLAREGTEFVYMGPMADCRECKVRNICFHLEKGTRYRVVGLRDVAHDCPMHEDGVVVAQVEPVPRLGVIPKRVAIEGSNIGWDIPKCRNRGCPHYSLCFLPGLDSGQKKKIVKVTDGVDCALGQSRVKVTLE